MESLSTLPTLTQSLGPIGSQPIYYGSTVNLPWRRQQIKSSMVKSTVTSTSPSTIQSTVKTSNNYRHPYNHLYKAYVTSKTSTADSVNNCHTNGSNSEIDSDSINQPCDNIKGEMLPSSPVVSNGLLINKSTVFLGGSCNPTTWRKDIAIPMLKALNITYYDPQKDHWEPELIELEDKAKKNAEVLFFVIDNQTRSIASMIEVSFIAATTKKLVLVIDLFPSLEPIINGEPISQYEHDILKGGRKLLMKLVERKGMPVFNQIPAALNYIPIIIARNHKLRGSTNLTIKVEDVVDGSVDGIDEGDHSLVALQTLTSILSPYELIKVKEVYDSCADIYTGLLSILDTKLAYLMLTGKELDEKLIDNLIDFQTTSDNITKENYSSNQFNSYRDNNNQQTHFNLNHHHHHLSNHTQQSQSQLQTQQQKLNHLTSRKHLDVNLNCSIEPNYNHLHHLNYNHLNHSHSLNQKYLNNHHNNNNNSSTEADNMDSTVTVNFKQFCSLILDHLQSTNLPTKSTSNQLDSRIPFLNISSTRSPPMSPSVNLLTSLVNLPQLDNCDHNNQQNDTKCKDSNCNVTDSQWTMKAKDIYLAGSDNPKDWRTSIAIPLIDQSNLTYSMPNTNSPIDWVTMGNDLCTLENCRVLLFVIGGQKPELETMILASHYFGQQFKVVLCVQSIPTKSVAQDNQISMAAIDDYNRGRTYLSEIARKENIEVFQDLEEAVKCAIKAATSCKPSSNQIVGE